MMKKLFLVHHIAEETGLHPDTIRNLADKGIIPSKRDLFNRRVFTGDAIAQLKLMASGTFKSQTKIKESNTGDK